MSRLRERYREDVVPAMMKEFSYSNVMQVPRLEQNSRQRWRGRSTRQRQGAGLCCAGYYHHHWPATYHHAGKKVRWPILNLREGRSIGVKVTLRGKRMWSFLDRMINVALPRRRDFRGISPDSFDGRGNYSLGFREQLVFPEVDYDKIDKIRGFEVSVVTTAQTDEEGFRLLSFLGYPFAQQQ